MPAAQTLALAYLAAAAGTAGGPGLLALLGQHAGDDGGPAAPLDHFRHRLLAFPLVHLSSLAADAGIKGWAASVLQRVADQGDLHSSESTSGCTRSVERPGSASPPALAACARYAVALEALCTLWCAPNGEARAGLAALRGHAATSGQAPAPLLLGMLCALLRHSDEQTCEEALGILVALADAGAGGSGTAVVVLAQVLQALREERRPALAMAMLRRLPGLGKRTEALPFVLLSLQRLLDPGKWHVLL